MSYSLILIRVPLGSTEKEVERAVAAASDAETTRASRPKNPEAERLKRALADALLAECRELERAEIDFAAIARADKITEEAARAQHRWIQLLGPEEGAGIEITLYDSFVSIDMAVGGTDEDWDDVCRYADVLVREGGFTIWDPQGPNIVERALKDVRPTKKKKAKTTERSDDRADVESEDVRRGGEVAKLINQIVDDAIVAPLATAGFRRSGRTWRRFLDDGVIQIVNVQWSPRHEGEGWFTLNAGVYFPALATSVALFPVTKTPKEWDCHIRKRPLLPGVSGWNVRIPSTAEANSDHADGVASKFFSWLDRRADRKAPERLERATRELRESLERYGFPWLEQASTLRGARDELVRSGHLFWAAHASLLLNDRDEAGRLLEHELAKSKSNPEYAETMRAWGRANGLIPL